MTSTTPTTTTSPTTTTTTSARTTTTMTSTTTTTTTTATTTTTTTTSTTSNTSTLLLLRRRLLLRLLLLLLLLLILLQQAVLAARGAVTKQKSARAPPRRGPAPECVAGPALIRGAFASTPRTSGASCPLAAWPRRGIEVSRQCNDLDPAAADGAGGACAHARVLYEQQHTEKPACKHAMRRHARKHASPTWLLGFLDCLGFSWLSCRLGFPAFAGILGFPGFVGVPAWLPGTWLPGFLGLHGFPDRLSFPGLWLPSCLGFPGFVASLTVLAVLASWLSCPRI